MRINNNLMAMNTHRQYAINNDNVAKSVEKLSSGYRINRAGDDAAGLAISEKMRAQIRGLSMASKNSQDGISLIQTAEGALQESHNILQRMRELAVQSASDTNETTIDRDALNKEFQALMEEIDDTAAKTKFNDLGLIDGTFAKYATSASPATIGTGVPPSKIYADALAHSATGPTTTPLSISLTYVAPGGAIPGPPVIPAAVGNVGTVDSASFLINPATDITADFVADTTSAAQNANTNRNWTIEVDALGNFTATSGGNTIPGTPSGDPYDNISVSGSTSVYFAGLGTITLTNTSAGNNTVLGSGTYHFGFLHKTGAVAPVPATPGPTSGTAGANPVISYTYADVNGVSKTVNTTLFAGQTRLQLENGVSIDFSEPVAADFSNVTTNILGAATVTFGVNIEETGFEFIVQTGANKGDELLLNIDKMDAKTLGIFGADVSSRQSASWSIQHVNNAINSVSTQRAALGAMQNRMEHKIANLDTSAENLQAAEARIRDLDMAKEMATFTKNNILSQASTAMLAQANSLPQGVLQLMQ